MARAIKKKELLNYIIEAEKHISFNDTMVFVHWLSEQLSKKIEIPLEALEDKINYVNFNKTVHAFQNVMLSHPNLTVLDNENITWPSETEKTLPKNLKKLTRSQLRKFILKYGDFDLVKQHIAAPDFRGNLPTKTVGTFDWIKKAGKSEAPVLLKVIEKVPLDHSGEALNYWGLSPLDEDIKNNNQSDSNIFNEYPEEDRLKNTNDLENKVRYIQRKTFDILWDYENSKFYPSDKINQKLQLNDEGIGEYFFSWDYEKLEKHHKTGTPEFESLFPAIVNEINKWVEDYRDSYKPISIILLQLVNESIRQKNDGCIEETIEKSLNFVIRENISENNGHPNRLKKYFYDTIDLFEHFHGSTLKAFGAVDCKEATDAYGFPSSKNLNAESVYLVKFSVTGLRLFVSYLQGTRNTENSYYDNFRVSSRFEGHAQKIREAFARTGHHAYQGIISNLLNVNLLNSAENRDEAYTKRTPIHQSEHTIYCLNTEDKADQLFNYFMVEAASNSTKIESSGFLVKKNIANFNLEHNILSSSPAFRNLVKIYCHLYNLFDVSELSKHDEGTEYGLEVDKEMRAFIPDFSIGKDLEDIHILIAKALHIYLTTDVELDYLDKVESKTAFEIPFDYYSAPQLTTEQKRKREALQKEGDRQAQIESDHHYQDMRDIFQGTGSDDERDVYGF